MLGWTVKICGIVNAVDACLVADAGADAIGLNFWHRSLRSISADEGAAIAAAIADRRVARVGVFVNEDLARMLEIARACRLDWIQLHGDEAPDIVGQLPGQQIIRALRPVAGTAEEVLAAARMWLRGGAAAILLDAPRLPRNPEDPDEADRGGTGRRVDPETARSIVSALDAPVILAGGLNPDNVAESIRQVRPAAVDAASGVETFPGRKSRELVARFVAQAKLARDGLPSLSGH